jgi:hypothetical protein
MTTYTMAEGRALAPGGLWHYVRAYGADAQKATLTLAGDCIRRNWELDGESVRHSEQVKGEALEQRGA